VKVSAEDARRFLVARHMLSPARSLQEGLDAALEVFRRWGSVQFDPLSVAGRSHDLVLHARVAGYDSAWSDQLYERRDVFEAYNKGLSLVLTDEYPWFRAPWSLRSARLLEDNPEVAERVLERIREEGPLSALDFERQRGAEVDWFGLPTNVVRAVLEAYADTGVLGLARREGNRRYYDLLERLLPAGVLEREGAAGGAASAQAPLALPHAWPARDLGRRRHLQRARPGKARPAPAGVSWSDRASGPAHR
jgi:uncharacterized protein